MRLFSIRSINGEQMTVVVQRRDFIAPCYSTWFSIGRKSYNSAIDPSEVLPKSLIKIVQYNLNNHNEDNTVNTLMLVGDYMAGWFYQKELESVNE